MEFYMPSRLVAGANCVGENASRLAALGKRCLLVTSGSAARRSGALADVCAALEGQGIAFTLFDEISQNPALSACQAAGRAAFAFGADFVLGIGGGSALDAAKAAAVFAADPDMTEAEFYSARWSKAPLPIVLVGTTAGTGSEVTSVSVLTDSAGRKHSIHDPRLYAALALGDARYTLSLPRSVTLSTGIDAVAHCVESAFSRKADRLSRLFSAQGVRLAFPALSAAVAGEELNLQQREQLYEASLLGGLAINRTGTVFPHNMGYYLTERYHIPHGFASAYLMADLLNHMDRTAPELLQDFFASCGVTEGELRALVERCLPPLEARATEAELLAALPRWENNGSVKNTLGEIGREQILAILKKHLL